ncbi:hypothetical protein [Streptomyces capitiformicae]|uniref:Uncharacterized protein n=1 Tax=Streptomyces capitiformicae TaxID=2014920 RepID=A0A919GNK0_9ACTN|nr:hypothetical protein [Streptomyces capitiformicae]GHH87847.1 hypothetical protein GCM10017771_30710 [Streptomyces capitiformicae]
MVTRQELLALAANTENLIARTPEPAAHQLEQRDRIIAAAHAAGITDAEISAARQASH